MRITCDMVDWQLYAAANPEISIKQPEQIFSDICEDADDDDAEINQLLAPFITNEAKSKIVHEYAPNYVELYYVDYRDNLDNHIDLLDQALQNNSLQCIEEQCFDWWDYPEGEYLNDIEKRMISDGLEGLYSDLEEDFKEYLWENDKSQPVKELLGNTGELSFFYSLGVEVDDMFASSESFESACYRMRRVLGIKKGTEEAKLIESIYRNNTYGGELRIYFSANLEDMIEGHEYDSRTEDWKTIGFDGHVYVVLVNSYQGSCDMERMEIHRKLPFKRENLHVSEVEKWSVEHVCGMCSDWCSDTDKPTFEYQPQKRKTIKTSSVNKELKREAEYAKTYKAGSCTFGDMDMRRHRDVHYINSYPCGHKCPHCGTFWID